MQWLIQGLSIIGFIITVISFQCKSNKKFFIMQGAGGTVFFIHFLLKATVLGETAAFAAAFFNLANLPRAIVMSKTDKKLWKLILTISLYSAAYCYSIYTIWGDVWKMALVTLPFVGLIIMSCLMWNGDPVKIRYGQLAVGSPTYLIHNIFIFSLGGLICEVFNMISSVIAIVRFKKEAK